MKMTDSTFNRILEKFLANYKVENVVDIPGLVRVDINPNKAEGWQTCTFIFTENHIVCFGDVSSYTWRTTWDAAEGIRHGHCNADNFYYLTEKLEHAQELKEFEFSDDVMDEIKKDIIEYYGLEGKKLKEFNKNWDDKYYLLSGVDKWRINGLDEFFEELDIDDYYEYLNRFEYYPDHYYLAVIMLRCIEKYFKEHKHE